VREGDVKKHRILIVGCGAVARHGHAPALSRNRGVEIAGLCDPSEEARALVADRHHLNAPTFASLEEGLAAVRPDSVDICTPGPTHDALVRQAILAGANVLVEKPPASSVAVARELAALADAHGVKLGTVLNYRYRDVLMRLRAAVDSGRLGRIKKVHIVHHGCLVYSDAPWLWNEAESKYLFREFGIHYLDTLVDLCGPYQRILWVHPIRQDSINVTTDVQVGIEFGDGAIGLLDMVADSTRGSSYFTHIHVYGTATDAFVRFFPPCIRFAAGLHNPIDILASEVKSFARLAALLVTRKYKAYRNLPHRRTLDMFCNWVVAGTPYPFELKRVIPTLELLEAVEARIPAYCGEPVMV